MSVDNWGICPKCMAIQEKKKEELRKKMDLSYGKISAEEYHELFLEITKPINIKSTLRENYDIWIDEEGKFEIVYLASCNSCGFKFDFTECQQIF